LVSLKNLPRANGMDPLPPGLAGRQNHDSMKKWQMADPACMDLTHAHPRRRRSATARFVGRCQLM
jgi:hypothetical protein